MADTYLGQIMLFAGDFAPQNFMLCQGQILLIAQNAALFSLTGTMYGGDGTTHFALPNLQGRALVGSGTPAGGTKEYRIGDTAGSETVQLTTDHLVPHSHSFIASTEGATSAGASGNVFATAEGGTKAAAATGALYSKNANAKKTALSASSLAPAGGNAAHNNMQPYMAVNMCICVQGPVPPRS